MAVTGRSLRAACSSRVGSGTIGIRNPIARPRPNETPLRNPVKEPGPVATATLVIGWRPARWRRWAMNAGSRADIDDSVILPFSSIVPARAMVDEVSMTKITLRPDHAAVAAQVLEHDQSRGGRIQPFAPFHDHCSLINQLVQAEITQL